MKAFSSLIVATALAACATSPPSIDVEAEAAELMRISREWSQVAGSGDLEAALAYWADDAVMMPPGMPPLKGKQAIREFVEASARIPGFAVSHSKPMSRRQGTSLISSSEISSPSRTRREYWLPSRTRL